MANIRQAITLLKQAQDQLETYGQGSQVSVACDLIEQAVCSLTKKQYQTDDFEFDIKETA